MEFRRFVMVLLAGVVGCANAGDVGEPLEAAPAAAPSSGERASATVACSPSGGEVIAALPSHPTEGVARGERVYWSDHAHRLWQHGEGRIAEGVASGSLAPYGASGVAWVEYGRGGPSFLVTIEPGGSVTARVPAEAPFVFDETSVYYILSDVLQVAPLSGGSARPLFTFDRSSSAPSGRGRVVELVGYEVGDLAIVDRHLYFQDGDAIRRVGAEGGPSHVVVRATATKLVAVDGALYYTDPDATVWRVPLREGGPTRPIAQLPRGVHVRAVQPSARGGLVVLYTDPAKRRCDGSIARVSADGAGGEVLASDLDHEATLFASDGPAVFASQSTVYRVAPR